MIAMNVAESQSSGMGRGWGAKQISSMEPETQT